MIFFLGCDVAKAKLDVSLADANGTELWADKITNEPVAIATALLTITGAYPDATVHCVVEATGCLHLALAETSQALGIPCRIYNPIITKQQIKASVRGAKTDRSDARIIARLGLQGVGRLYTPEPHKATKYYVRGIQRLSEMASSLTRYETHLSGILEDELTQAAKDMVTGIQAQFKAAKAQFIADTTATAPAELMLLLRSIPGVGPYIAASIIGELQDIRYFSSAKALIAFAGLDPKIRQSGHSLNNTGRLSKRGSPHLRRSLFIAANVARQHDTYFGALYDKKRAEGKRHTVANVVVARQLLKVVRAVWLRGEPYNTEFTRTY